jgi:ribose transport system substrate-binding protein
MRRPNVQAEAHVIGNRDRRQRRRAGVIITLAMGTAAATWAGYATPLTAAATDTSTPSADAQQCGEDVSFEVADPDGVLSSLSPEAQGQYGTWPFEVRATPWLDFEGTEPPWTIGFVSYPIEIPWQQALLEGLENEVAAAREKGLVEGDLVTYVQPSQATATPEQQIAAIQQMVRDGVDGILVSPLLTTPLGPAIDAAGEQGVPVIMLSNVVPNSTHVINVWSNNNSPASAGVAGLVQEGNVLIVRGISGNTVEDAFHNAAIANIEACPGLEVVGEVWGNWAIATAKTAVLQYLAANPGQEIDAVIQHGGMMPGIVDAFQTAGRTVPPISDGNASGGDLSWWLANKDTYSTVGTTFTGEMTAWTEMRILFRVLAGNGLKLRDLSFAPPVITNDNLETFATPGQDLYWPGQALGPLDEWCDNTCLDEYFVTPGTPGDD